MAATRVVTELRSLQDAHHASSYAFGRHGGTLREDNREASEEDIFDAPRGLGQEAIPISAGLQSINPRYHMYDAHQHGVREGATSALLLSVWGSP